MRRRCSRLPALGMAALGMAALTTGSAVASQAPPAAPPVQGVETRPIEFDSWTNDEIPAARRADYRRIGASEPAARASTIENAAAEKHWLTVRHLDRNGNPATSFRSRVVGLDNPIERASGADDVWRVELPEGRYHLNSFVSTGSGDSAAAALLARPGIELESNMTIIADARKADPVSIGVRSAPAFDAVDVHSRVRTPTTDWDFSMDSLAWPGGLYTAHLGPTVPSDELISYIDAQAFDAGSNTVYALAPYWKGQQFSGFDKTYTLDELARVTRRQLAQADGKQATVELTPLPPGVNSGLHLVRRYRFDLPSTVTAYATANRAWWYEGFGQGQQYWLAAGRSYPQPKRYAESWNAAVFHPTVGLSTSESVPPIGRNRNLIQVALDPFSDSGGNGGDATTNAGSGLTLYRNGEQIGTGELPSYGEFTVPAERARYRLEYSATRSAGTEFSTKLDCTWTFESSRVEPPGNQPWAPMPMWGFQITPDVDDHNRVPRTRHRLPLVAKSTPGSDVGELADPTVEISLDDGDTWTNARVEPEGEGRWNAVVPVTEDATYVSLRLKAKDSKGNRLTETIIHAYGIAG